MCYESEARVLVDTRFGLTNLLLQGLASGKSSNWNSYDGETLLADLNLEIIGQRIWFLDHQSKKLCRYEKPDKLFGANSTIEIDRER